MERVFAIVCLLFAFAFLFYEHKQKGAIRKFNRFLLGINAVLFVLGWAVVLQISALPDFAVPVHQHKKSIPAIDTFTQLLYADVSTAVVASRTHLMYVQLPEGYIQRKIALPFPLQKALAVNTETEWPLLVYASTNGWRYVLAIDSLPNEKLAELHRFEQGWNGGIYRIPPTGVHLPYFCIRPQGLYLTPTPVLPESHAMPYFPANALPAGVCDIYAGNNNIYVRDTASFVFWFEGDTATHQNRMKGQRLINPLSLQKPHPGSAGYLSPEGRVPFVYPRMETALTQESMPAVKSFTAIKNEGGQYPQVTWKVPDFLDVFGNEGITLINDKVVAVEACKGTRWLNQVSLRNMAGKSFGDTVLYEYFDHFPPLATANEYVLLGKKLNQVIRLNKQSLQRTDNSGLMYNMICRLKRKGYGAWWGQAAVAVLLWGLFPLLIALPKRNSMRTALFLKQYGLMYAGFGVTGFIFLLKSMF